MPQAVVIIGVQWGDEGKGKIVDYYSSAADVVARFQGGNNAGHTLVVEGKQTILHLIPSGILHPHTRCAIGSGVVVDPENLLKEVEVLRKAGVPDLENRIWLSDRSHLIVDYHKHLDAARENRKGGKIGTTKRGIGPAYEDRAARRGLRVSDLYHEKLFEERLKNNLEEKNFLLEKYYGVPPVNMEQFQAKYRDIGAKLKPFVKDVSRLMAESISAGEKILYEGAQGVLLDMDYGTYPYVTSSHTLPSQAALGLGARVPVDTLFVGVIKAYSTRVGEGPFPTELSDAMGNRLRETGHEFGATTGRPRRCGWLDLVAVKYALRVSGIKNLAITKSDVLSGIEQLKVCTAYELDGKIIDTFPADTDSLNRVKPIYETLPGWKEPLTEVRKYEELPSTFKDYLKFIEQFTNSRINLLSTGAGREQVIDLQKAF
ncbi:MAG: adenylosuccinate synthase [Proteobacteria bacterium]|nr:adenylosuccinate synthase [Pseudomonadota bacterium]